MNPRIQIIAIVGSLCIMLLVFWLIRRRKLREEYAFLWFGASIGLITVSLWRGSLGVIAGLVGVAYPPSVLLLAGIVLGFFLAMHYSMSLSHLAEQNKRLAQEIALLRREIEQFGPQWDQSRDLSYGKEADFAANEDGSRVIHILNESVP